MDEVTYTLISRITDILDYSDGVSRNSEILYSGIEGVGLFVLNVTIPRGVKIYRRRGNKMYEADKFIVLDGEPSTYTAKRVMIAGWKFIGVTA